MWWPKNQRQRKKVKTEESERRLKAIIIWPWMPMIKRLQANWRASEDIITVLMSAAFRAWVEIVQMQEPSVKEDEDRRKAKIKDAKYIYIDSDDIKKSFVITAVREDLT
jgi:hypothetical protein